MGIQYSTQPNKDSEFRYMLEQCEDDLGKLNMAARSIKETIDIQHEAIQTVFNNRSAEQQHDLPQNSAATEPVLEDLKGHELRAMASMQNLFCIQAFEIQNATERFSGLLKEIRRRFNLDSPVDFIKLPIDTKHLKRIESDHTSRTDNLNAEYYKELLEEKDRDLKDKQLKIEKLEREVKRFRKEKRESEEKEHKLNAKLTQPSEQRHELSGRFQTRKNVTAVLYTPRKADTLSMATREIIDMLRNQFATINTDLRVTECAEASALPQNVPIITLCINASRLGTDVSNALQGLTVTSQVAVVILHHKEIHALPNQASERVLTSIEYKSLGGMFDMAFLSQRGVYPCDMNNKTVSALVEFIRHRNNSL